MKLSDIQKTAIQLGIESDLRGKNRVLNHLKKHREQYKLLSKADQESFDTDILDNPYPDSRINYGDPNREVKKILAGIDMQAAEVLLADRLGDIDLIIAHHPEGKALAKLHEVMHMQAEIFALQGVPINIAEDLLKDRISEVNRSIHKGNHYRGIDTAQILDIAFMCSHTVCDNLGARFITDLVAKGKPETLNDIIKILGSVPEYQQAKELGAPPMIFAGSGNNRCGKIIVEFTGGTNGPSGMYEHLARAGIGTIIGMHMSDEARKEALKHHINIVMTSHMSSDSLGMNLFLDTLEKKGIEIIPTSGLIRVSINKIGKHKKKNT